MLSSKASAEQTWLRRTAAFVAGTSLCAACLLFSAAARPQDKPATSPAETRAASPASPKAQSPVARQPANPTAEVATTDSQTPFRVRVNVVLVRAVVRDEKGHAVGNLKKEDFRLFDNRKEQSISSFTIETPEKIAVEARPINTSKTTGETPGAAETAGVPVVMPQRYVALLFDDQHLRMEDAVTLRSAAMNLFSAVKPSDRVGIYSTSGQVTEDFTNDQDALKNKLKAVVPRGFAESHEGDCPPMSYYQADQIMNRNDRQALEAAMDDAIACLPDKTPDPMIHTAVLSVAQRTLTEGDINTQYAYRHIEDALRRLAAMPGQRILVFASPGFLYTSDTLTYSDIIDRALRSNIVIDTLDARGLYTPDLMGDISEHQQPRTDPRTRGLRSTYRLQEQNSGSQVLADFAAGTGGTYFHNRNDLDEGLREAVGAPPVSYLLSFSPQNLKLDGRFHFITVKLADDRKYTVQARHGYYAPKTLKDPAEQAKEEIEEAIFSQEEIQGVPVDLQTQFFKQSSEQVKLAVLARVGLQGMRFRKADGRNRDEVTIATAIFDQNGNFVTGGEKIVQMRLFDSTYERLSRSGLTVKSSFDVKPGTYLVRLVVRDGEGEQMAARNGAVSIPY
jgi:VWFA-related protein